MPQPTSSAVHVNKPLTNISVAYMQSEADFVSPVAFPLVPVEKQSDLYFTYDKDSWFKSQAQLRAPSTESAGGGYGISTASYFANKFAIHKDIDDDIVVNADTPLSMERDSTMWVTRQLLLKREVDWANTFFKTGVWATESTPSTLWSAASGSTPIEDIAAKKILIKERTGFDPNVLVLGPYTYNALRQNAEILARIVYTQRGIVTTDILAALFDVDRVIVANAVQNTAQEGQTASLSFIHGKHALLMYANPTPSLMQPSAGYIFTWTGLEGAGAFGNRIKRFRDEKINSTRIEGELAYDMKVVGSDLGHLFLSAVN